MSEEIQSILQEGAEDAEKESQGNPLRPTFFDALFGPEISRSCDLSFGASVGFERLAFEISARVEGLQN